MRERLIRGLREIAGRKEPVFPAIEAVRQLAESTMKRKKGTEKYGDVFTGYVAGGDIKVEAQFRERGTRVKPDFLVVHDEKGRERRRPVEARVWARYADHVSDILATCFSYAGRRWYAQDALSPEEINKTEYPYVVRKEREVDVKGKFIGGTNFWRLGELIEMREGTELMQVMENYLSLVDQPGMKLSNEQKVNEEWEK